MSQNRLCKPCNLFQLYVHLLKFIQPEGNICIMLNFSWLWGPALQWQIQFKLSQNTCIRISPGPGAGSTSDVGQTLSLGALPCFSVIALLSRIGVGKRWGLGAIRSDSFRWIETFSQTRKSDKEQSLGTGSGTESITFAIILYLLVYFDSTWFVFKNPKNKYFLLERPEI